LEPSGQSVNLDLAVRNRVSSVWSCDDDEEGWWLIFK